MPDPEAVAGVLKVLVSSSREAIDQADDIGHIPEALRIFDPRGEVGCH